MLQPMSAARQLTIEDLFAGGADLRAELIHGEIVPKAAPHVPHTTAEGKLSSWAARRFDRKPGGRWPGSWWIRTEIHTVYAAHEVFCHDIAGWRRHEKRDLLDKLSGMHAAGVPDYWVIDHEEQIVFLYRHRAEGYVMRSISAHAVMHAPPFDAVELRLACIFGDEDDVE